MVRAGDVIRASDVAVQACVLTHSVGQTIAEGTTPVTVTYDTELSDTDGMHTSGSPTRITIQTAGFYVVGFAAQLAADSDYERTFGIIRLNGSTEIARVQVPGTAAGLGALAQLVSVQTYRIFSAGDYIESQVIQLESGTTAHTLEVVSERSPIFYAGRLGS